MLDAGVAAGTADRGDVLNEPNAIGASLGLLGDEWTLLIARGAFEGARRYGDWKASLPISDAVLTARLGTLVDAGVLMRVPSGDVASRHEYRLSRAGLDLWQLLLCIWDWERRHVVGQDERLPRMVHLTCGADFHPTLRCSGCSSAAAVGDIDARFGPSGSFERSMPVGRTRRRPTAPGSSGGGSSATYSGPGLFAETMAIIGNRWSSAVLGAAFLGATRFRDFARIGAPPAIVSDRLRSFVELGVLDNATSLATTASGGPPAYRLSPKGEAFLPVVVSFLRWGERWFPATDGPAIAAVHRTCGQPFVPELACSACDGVLSRRSVHIHTNHADQADAGRVTAVETAAAFS